SEAFEPQFDHRRFEEFRSEIEAATRWQYSGDVDLLILNARLNPATGKAALDFRSTVVCQLDTMLADKAIRSVAEFFERVFRFAESHRGEDATWGFSYSMAGVVGRSSILPALLSL